MMIEERSVKYTKDVIDVKVYDTGLQDWNGLDNLYANKFFRNKVICRFDVVRYLDKYFEEETIRNHRTELLILAKMIVTDPVIYSNAIMEFIRQDAKFRQSIISLYNSCPEDEIFGYYLSKCFADVIKGVEDYFRMYFRGEKEVVICISNGYLYFSVADEDYIPTLPSKVECEVVSCAKAWSGSVKYV